MKSKIVYMVVVGLLAFNFIACEDYLDPGYVEFTTEEDVFTSYSMAQQAVRTMYSYLPSGYHSVAGAMEACMTDEAKHSDETSSIKLMNNGTVDSRTYVDAWMWNHYYTGIQKIAIFLDNVNKETTMFIDADTHRKNPTLNAKLKVEYRGEAYFLRAFYYFELLKRFADPSKNLGVPIQPEKVLTIKDDLDFPRASYTDCIEYILNDLENAIERMPLKYGGADYGRASAGVAMALKSRVLLYHASPLYNPNNDMNRWTAAAEAAKDLIKTGAYSLVPRTTVSQDEMYSVFSNPSNTEIIFSTPVAENKDFETMNYPPSLSGRGLTNPTQNLVDAFDMLLGYPIDDDRGRYEPERPYNRRDNRLRYFIGYNGGTVKGVELASFVGGKDGINGGSGFTKTGYYIRKFQYNATDLVDGNSAAGRHIWPHFRYAEILLNYAEALTMLYNPYEVPKDYPMSAYDAIKLIRDRVSATMPVAYWGAMTQEQFMLKVKNERRIELCFEGHRYWDVRRWKEADKYLGVPIEGMAIVKDAETGNLTYNIVTVENRVWEERMYALPIPYSELLKSKVLKQNEGW